MSIMSRWLRSFFVVRMPVLNRRYSAAVMPSFGSGRLTRKHPGLPSYWNHSVTVASG